MKQRIIWTSLGLFITGFTFGFRYFAPIVQFLAPQLQVEWSRLMLTFLFDLFYLRLACGFAFGGMFASAVLATLVSGRLSLWGLQVPGYLAASFLALTWLAPPRDGSQQDGLANYSTRHSIFASAPPLLELPLASAAVAILVGAFIRVRLPKKSSSP
ncbi:MAG: hypothetical protein JWL59_4501 [Chthoniobacteraceae bacterium]|nr:hypothetical protein [Chthoniobacteraceae bacterium]